MQNRKCDIKVNFVHLGVWFVSRVLVKMLVMWVIHHGYLMIGFSFVGSTHTTRLHRLSPPAGPSSSLPGVPELGRMEWLEIDDF